MRSLADESSGHITWNGMDTMGQIHQGVYQERLAPSEGTDPSTASITAAIFPKSEVWNPL